MPAEHRGRHDPGVHGGRGVRQAVQAEEAHADAVVQQERGDLPAGRYPVSDVPRRRYAQVAHHRGARPGAADQEESERTTDAGLVSDGTNSQ